MSWFAYSSASSSSCCREWPASRQPATTSRCEHHMTEADSERRWQATDIGETRPSYSSRGWARWNSAEWTPEELFTHNSRCGRNVPRCPCSSSQSPYGRLSSPVASRKPADHLTEFTILLWDWSPGSVMQ